MEQGMEMLFALFGGLAMFLYGMDRMSRALQRAAGDAMKRLLARLTATPLLGVLTGLAVTAVLQSSSAATVMVIGFVSAGLLELPRAVAVIYGINIGTTMTAQLIAFDVQTLVYPVLFLGFLLDFAARRPRWQAVGEAVFSFGLLFEGIDILGRALQPLAGQAVFLDWMTRVKESPLLGILLGLSMTMVVQSSSATIALLQNVARQAGPDGIHSMLGLAGAVPVLLGDNIGTTVTALLACIVTLGLACMIGAQMLIARTPRVFGKLWPELLALCAVLLALTLCIKADLFGFERRIPQTDQVESVEVYHRGIYGSAAKITDPEEIDAIVQAHRYLADCGAKDNLDSDWRWRNNISITYHLKNGGTLSRRYQLRDEDLTAVRAMLESETFRRSLVLDDVNVNADALRHGYINNSDKDLIRDLSAQECKLLYQTLLEDIAHMNMLDPDLYDYQNSRLDITLEDDEKTFSARLNPQCTRTLALLQEWGLIGSPGEAFDAKDDGDAEDTIAYSGGMPNIAIA